MKSQKTKEQIIRGGGNSVELKCDAAVREHIHIIIEGNKNEIIIEEMVQITDRLTIHIVDDNSIVHIGRGTTFEETSISVADSNNCVTIGEDCMFARNTAIIASDFHSIIDLSTGHRKNKSKKVEIDNHVWVGYGAIILKNTRIFSNSVICAGAIVRKDVLSNSIYIASSDNETNKKITDTTWERARSCSVPILKMYTIEQREQLETICYEDKILVNIENDITTYFNKIKGWIIWKHKDSKLSEMYICCYFRKNENEKCWIVPITLYIRTDVAEYLNDKKYEVSGFDSYMPATIINNWEYIKKVDIIMRNGEVCGRKNILNKI